MLFLLFLEAQGQPQSMQPVLTKNMQTHPNCTIINTKIRVIGRWVKWQKYSGCRILERLMQSL